MEDVNTSNHLFLIGIDEYPRNPLKNCVSDLTALREVLVRRYEYDADHVKFLTNENATRSAILTTLEEYANENLGLGEGDTLTIAFAGHGHYDEDEGRNWWVCAPADGKNITDGDYLSQEGLFGKLNKLRCKHIFIIIDACFAGATLAGKFAQGKRSKDKLPAPFLLCSGGIQPVSDGHARSPFMERLINALDKNTQSGLFLDDLAKQVLTEPRWTSLQRPHDGQLDGCGVKSDRFFLPLRPEFAQTTASAVVPPIASTTQSIAERLRRGSRQRYDNLKKGRFKFLNIADILLTEGQLSIIEVQAALEKSNHQNTEKDTDKLYPLLKKLWKDRDFQPALLMGDGGMGKTTSCVHLWEWLNSSDDAPIPLYVSLNEYNAIDSERQKKHFIEDHIFQHYLGISEFASEAERRPYYDLLRQPTAEGEPVALLLLDGLNEVTRDRGWLEKEIREWVENFPGVQVVCTSRYDLRGFEAMKTFARIDLLDLTDAQKEQFLKNAHAKTGMSPQLPKNPALRKLLGNPMMLALYAMVGGHYAAHADTRRVHFLTNVSTTAELLWNFCEAQLAKQLDAHPEEKDKHWADFLVHHLLPSIAYRMERAEAFVAAENDFEKMVDEAFEDVERQKKRFFDAFSRFKNCFTNRRDVLKLKEQATKDENLAIERYVQVKDWLCHRLQLLVEEGGVLRFLHQNFRDFFAACHLRHAAHLALQHHELPAEWTERYLPIYLRRMVGELEGEHHFDPYKADKGNHKADNLLACLLKACRHRFHEEATQCAVWNAAMSIADVRGSLAGVDLSHLDLRRLYFNGMCLSHPLDHHRYLPARLEGSLLWSKHFFPQGHSEGVLSVSYSPDGKRVLTGSSDKTAKEWSVETGECLRTFENIPGLMVFGCDLRHLHPDSLITEEEKRLLRIYRAMV